MKPRRTISFFQLQLGQEVIYLLLSFFALLVLVLALYVTVQNRQISSQTRQLEDQGRKIERLGHLISDEGVDLAKVHEFERTAMGLAAEVKAQKVTIDQLNGQLADLQRRLEAAMRAAAILQAQIDPLKAERDRVLKDLEKARSDLQQLTDRPPIISLSEAQGYTFRLGDNGLSTEFKQKLSGVVIPKLVEAGERYRADVIEVIGHTDEVRVSERASNLDTRLLPFLRGSDGGLMAGDNVGLGMSRAASVVRYLKNDARLKAYSVLPLSGGQVIEIGDTLSAGSEERDTRERRRIEIRLRRR